MIHAFGEKEHATKISSRLVEARLQHTDIRKTILRRFLYQNLDFYQVVSAYQSKMGGCKGGIDDTEVNFSPFSIAVRRFREKDRRLFYAKDTMLYDGIQ